MTIDETAEHLDSMLAFHRRVERHLASLAALPSQLARGGPGPATASTADALIACFDRECGRRHAEEERELLPMLERCIVDEVQRGYFRSLRRTLAEQHRAMELAWRAVRRPLVAVAEGLARDLQHEDIAYMRALFGSHIHGEEAALHRVTAMVAASARSSVTAVSARVRT